MAYRTEAEGMQRVRGRAHGERPPGPAAAHGRLLPRRAAAHRRLRA